MRQAAMLCLALCLLGVVLPVRAARVGTLEAAAGVVRRLLPAAADRFNLTLDPTLSDARGRVQLPSTSYDVFVVEASNGTVSVVGSSAVALASGTYWYLKHVANGLVTWGLNGTGDQLNLPEPLPDVPRTAINSSVPWRYAWNTCTFSYTATWWDWPRWEREIDWMALHGVNMPLAFTGQEYIWANVFSRYNVTLAELGEWFTGPAFMTWQRFGNIQMWNGPLSQFFLQGQRDLQVRILRRMRELGMVPVLPCFAGHLPQVAKRVWPKANITNSSVWNNFPANETAVYYVSPTDPLFMELGAAFLSELIAEFGHDGYFNCDMYNELTPATTNTTFLRNAGAVVSESIQAVVPGGIWVMQAWLFHFSYWQAPGRVEAYLSGVPNDRMLILDLNSEDGALAPKFKQYYGKPWVWNMLHNFGGVRGMYGNLTRIATGPMGDLEASGSTMVGIGFTPEAIEQNPVMYELLTDTFWTTRPIDPTAWLEQYVTRRYGSPTPGAVMDAWETLFDAVYAQPGEPRSEIEWVPEWITPSFGWQNGDATLMLQAAKQFLAGAASVPSPATNGPYQYDLVDITRQAATMFFSDVHRMLDNAALRYTNNSQTLRNMATLMQGLISQLDALLATNPNFLFGHWTHGTQMWAADSEEYSRFLFGAKNQVTLWGPRAQICDYAAKAWSGLYSSYYLRRWTYFLNKLIGCRESGVVWVEHQYQQEMLQLELNWNAESTQYPNTTTGSGADAIRIAGDILKTITTPIGQGPSYKFRLYQGIDMVGGDFQISPLWTTDVDQLSLLCSLEDTCVGFNAFGSVKKRQGEFYQSDIGALYIRESATAVVAAAEAFINTTNSWRHRPPLMRAMPPASVDDAAAALPPAGGPEQHWKLAEGHPLRSRSYTRPGEKRRGTP